jgi:hypothetical protein
MGAVLMGDVLMNERNPACTQQCKSVSAMQEVTPHIEEARRGGGVSDEARCHYKCGQSQALAHYTS